MSSHLQGGSLLWPQGSQKHRACLILAPAYYVSVGKREVSWKGSHKYPPKAISFPLLINKIQWKSPGMRGHQVSEEEMGENLVMDWILLAQLCFQLFVGIGQWQQCKLHRSEETEPRNEKQQTQKKLEKIGEKRNDKDRRNLSEFMLTQAALGNENGFHKCPVRERQTESSFINKWEEDEKNSISSKAKSPPIFFPNKIEKKRMQQLGNNGNPIQIAIIVVQVTGTAGNFEYPPYRSASLVALILRWWGN